SAFPEYIIHGCPTSAKSDGIVCIYPSISYVICQLQIDRRRFKPTNKEISPIELQTWVNLERYFVNKYKALYFDGYLLPCFSLSKEVPLLYNDQVSSTRNNQWR